jgi:TatA/E family protein of Tat protein translocase
MGSLGVPEILIILVIALIVFGPRKLPELGKTLGQGLAQFRRASEDFKRQWEDEVDIERRRLEAPPPTATEIDDSAYRASMEQSPVEASTPDASEGGSNGGADSAETAGQTPGDDIPSSTSEPAVVTEQSDTVARETSRDWA